MRTHEWCLRLHVSPLAPLGSFESMHLALAGCIRRYRGAKQAMLAPFRIVLRLIITGLACVLSNVCPIDVCRKHTWHMCSCTA